MITTISNVLTVEMTSFLCICLDIKYTITNNEKIMKPGMKYILNAVSGLNSGRLQLVVPLKSSLLGMYNCVGNSNLSGMSMIPPSSRYAPRMIPMMIVVFIADDSTTPPCSIFLDAMVMQVRRIAISNIGMKYIWQKAALKFSRPKRDSS